MTGKLSLARDIDIALGTANGTCMNSPSPNPVEKYYAPHEIAETLHMSLTWVYRAFRNYPGVLWLGERKPDKRSSLILRIPQELPAGLIPATFHPAFRIIGRSKEVAGSAMQSSAQFVQDVGPKHCRAVVVEGEQGWVRHTGLLSQAIHRPLFLLQDFSQPANDHSSKVTVPNVLCQPCLICEACFTHDICRSNVAPLQRGLRAPGMQWNTTTTIFCARFLKPFLGLLALAAEVRP